MLKAAIAQRLLPRADGLGRVPAVEVMVATAFIRDCIVDKDRTSMIHGAIAAGTSQYGMQTFDQSIFSLYQQGLVTLEEALRWASNVDEFKLKVQGISTTAELARDEMAKSGGVGGGSGHHPVRWTERPLGIPRRSAPARHGASCRSRECAPGCSTRDHPQDDIDAAIAHLLETGALDDAPRGARVRRGRR